MSGAAARRPGALARAGASTPARAAAGARASTCAAALASALVGSLVAGGVASGCGRTCNEVGADTQATIEALARGCDVDADCRLVRATDVFGAPVCALPCDVLAVRASLTDDDVRASLSDEVEDFEGCDCNIRARCAPASFYRPACGYRSCFASVAAPTEP